MEKLTAGQERVLLAIWNGRRMSTTKILLYLKDYFDEDISKQTLNTRLKELEEKGIITRLREGRVFYYFSKLTKEEFRDSLLRQVNKDYFSGDYEKFIDTLNSIKNDVS